MITIRFRSGEQKTYKAGSAEVENGVLILLVYAKDRGKLRRGSKFSVAKIEWACLDNGSFVIGNPNPRIC
jgi:hypothetical protein